MSLTAPLPSPLFHVLLATRCTEQVSTDCHEELSALPDDEEVKELEAIDAQRAVVYAEATDWATRLPWFAKLLLLLSAGMTACACWLVQFYPRACFESFAVTSTVEQDLDGSVLNLMKTPGGWLVVGLTAGAVITLNLFSCWASGQVARRSKSAKGRVAMQEQPQEQPQEQDAKQQQ